MKRNLLLLGFVLLAGCSDDGAGTCAFNGATFVAGETFPSGDGCNSCTCTGSGVECTNASCSDAGVDAAAIDAGLDASVDAKPATCEPNSSCTTGPLCGTKCCNAGERCDNGTCYCGTGPACGIGDRCESAGPISDNNCGTICCGASGPCPN